MNRIFLIGILGILLFSCTPEEGLGGEASISGQVKHHDDPIPNSLVLIKYGATELPGTNAGDYDDQTLASSTDGSFQFESLEKGSYYLYSMGYDSTIVDSVFGGLHVTVKKGEALEIDIPITE